MDNYKTIIEIGSFSIKTIIYSELNKDFSIIGTGKTRSLSTPVDGVQNIGSKDGNSFHIGYVSQVLLYKRELSASEVLQNYDALKSRYGY